MRHALPFLLAILPLTGCAHSVDHGAEREGWARLGETVYVNGPSVRPLRIIEDSRCPQNVQCVWAGRMVLRAVVSGGNWSREMDLTLGQPQPVADGRVTLVSAQPEKAAPEKSATGDTAPRNYRFAFAFQGGL